MKYGINLGLNEVRKVTVAEKAFLPQNFRSAPLDYGKKVLREVKCALVFTLRQTSLKGGSMKDGFAE